MNHIGGSNSIEPITHTRTHSAGDQTPALSYARQVLTPELFPSPYLFSLFVFEAGSH